MNYIIKLLSALFLIFIFLKYSNKIFLKIYYFYKVFVFSFISNKKNKYDFLFIGDSLIEYFNDVNRFSNSITNKGIRGDTTKGLIKRFKCSITNVKFDNVVLLIGTNDIVAKKSLEDIIYNIDYIIKNINRNIDSNKIYIQSLYPVNMYRGFYKVKNRDNEFIKKVNSEIIKVCKKYSVNYINVYDFLLKNDELNIAYTYDGLHLNEIGYKKVSECLEKNIEKLNYKVK